jgi:hypothetical protein
MRQRALDITPLHPEEDEAAAEARVARSLAHLGGHRMVVDTFSDRGPVIARCLATLDPDLLARGAARGALVRVVFAQGNPEHPIVMGFVDDETGAAAPGAPAEPVVASPAWGQTDPGLELHVDGRPRVLPIEAQEELILKCGQASITLQRDGKIVIKGRYVESRASSTNRIKGAQVKIN